MAVQLRLPDYSTRHFEAEIVTLPATVELKHANKQRQTLLFALFISAFGYFMLWRGLAFAGLFHPVTLIGLILAAVGGANFAKGLTLKRASRMTFSEDMVMVEEKRLFGADEWQEPLRNYQGLRLRTGKHKIARARKTDPYQIIELIHPQKSKTLPLYAKRGETPPRDHLEHYADILDLPILDETAS